MPYKVIGIAIDHLEAAHVEPPLDPTVAPPSDVADGARFDEEPGILGP
jgi:hypothetical protein